MQKTHQKEFRIEKILKKGNKLYVKWKGYDNSFKGALSGLRQFLAVESPLKMMKNAFFYFTSKALFVVKIFKVLS